MGFENAMDGRLSKPMAHCVIARAAELVQALKFPQT